MPTTHNRLIAVGSALPPKAVSNAELAQMLAKRGIETSDAWIRERTGIAMRHFVSDGQTTSDLATIAAQQAITKSGVATNEIDLLIVATSTPDRVFPSTACLVQRQLGIDRCTAFDVQAVCSGFVYALCLADSLMKTQNYRHALVIGAETFSNILDWQDRTTCVLFGDGAGAVVLKKETLASPAPNPPCGIIDSELGADGRYSDILCVPGQVRNGVVTGDPFLRMDGQAVFKFAVNILAECALTVLHRQKLSANSIDWLIPHQANARIMSGVAKKLKIAESTLISTVDRHANTSAASIPLALAVGIDEGKVAQGDQLMLLGVGGGFTWGGVLLRYG